MIARRALLATGLGALGAAVASPAPALSAPALSSATRRIAFNNLHTGELVELEYYEKGAYHPDALAVVNHVMRDWRTGDVHEIDPKLLDLLVSLKERLETPQPIAIVSGFRSAKTNAMLAAHSSEVANGSLHMVGQAIDVCIEGVDTQHLHNAALSLQLGGVGYYPVTGFVHVDVGPVRHWQGT
jgi:uncharacterized protein YcbK (DUF882 family)